MYSYKICRPIILREWFLVLLFAEICFAPSTPTREHSLTKSPITCCISKVLLKGLKTTNPPLTLSIFACGKNNLLCHKNNVSIFDETIISWACDFSNQELLSKMMLNAYSQVFITHSGFAVEN